jgi:fructokinase
MILSCGEALFDMIQMPGSTTIEPVVGGSTLNVALGLARLGRKTGYLTRLSTDYFGKRLRDFLDKEGIDTSFTPEAPGAQTTLGFAFLQPGGHAEYAFYTAGASDRYMTKEHLPASLSPEVAAVHFGSFSLAIEPIGTTLADFLVEVAPTRVISLDPNIRASLIADRAAWLARFDRLLPLADFLKASIEDVQWIYGADATAEETARRWSLSGPRIAIVTDGEVGATVAVDGRSVFVPAHKVEVIDTVGAGDTFQASCLARIDELGLLSKSAIRGIDLATAEEIAKFAVAAAAITCTRRGADLPSRADVDAFLSR